ncbi:hypothetical protein ABGB17_28350 [Sphaerisporangium sp. B11E5]|uniref:hypothetical protein n=1 Tax=Sphaerisporangium sp. B11E5 TaxID=3153563 RepID=UPI00325F0DC1
MGTGRRVIDEGIGPWGLSPDGTALVRRADPPLGEWPRQSGSWPRDERISVRPEKPFRVTLIGESVARGFLLDPVVTLADLCRTAFRAADPGDRLELVDLTVNNLAPGGALKLCRAAVELGSALIVLYVGNNFLRSTPWLGPDDRETIARTYASGGFEGYLGARRAAVAALARRFRGEVEELCASAGVRVVVVVPAVNQLDWLSPWTVPTWLPGDRVAEWVATRERLGALSDEDGTAPDPGLERALAERLAGLDGGTTPRPLEIIGRGLVRSGQEEEGLELLSHAISVGADPANYDRRCPPEVAAELRLLGGHPGCRLVDVPALLRARYGAKAFGKEVFLDYCHHTLESLQLVAHDITAEVFAGAGLETAPGWRATASAAGVPSRDLAAGYLLSALHNQHWGQPAETVEYWLARAARTDSASVRDLTTYFAMSMPDAHFWLSGDRLADRSERMYWFLKNFSHLAVLDARFAQRALRVLDEAGEALLRKELDALWLGLRVEEQGEVNLLEPFWRERDGGPESATVFLGERAPVSRYGFLASGDRPLGLEIVLAAGPALPDGRFAMRLNGHLCHTGTVTPEWTTHRITLPPALLRAGANELAYAWPAAARDPDGVLAQISRLGTGPESLHLVRVARMRLSGPAPVAGTDH